MVITPPSDERTDETIKLFVVERLLMVSIPPKKTNGAYIFSSPLSFVLFMKGAASGEFEHIEII